MKRILVCEDEDVIRDFVVINLQRSGYTVVDVSSGEEALRVYDEQDGDFDIALLDITLPGMDGFAVCKKLRERSSTMGIIFLSARTQEMDKVGGLMLGADDYVTKPFSPKELIARIKAILKRTKGEEAIYKYETLVLDDLAHEVTIDDEPVLLTPKEYDLLKYFMKNKNIALSRDAILSNIWGYDFYGDERTVDTHVKTLRNNLGKYRDVIKTVRGMGYKFDVKDKG